MKTNFTVSRFGVPLDPSLYTWDEENKTLTTQESNLVIDAYHTAGMIFYTGNGCMFKTSSDCAFYTGKDCIFQTGSRCAFQTGSNCQFTTGSNCNFTTGSNCHFITESHCNFNHTGIQCVFTTGAFCRFLAVSGIFNIGPSCKFYSVGMCSMVIRRDIDEMYPYPEGKRIEVERWHVKGFKELNFFQYKNPEEIFLKDGI